MKRTLLLAILCLAASSPPHGGPKLVQMAREAVSAKNAQTPPLPFGVQSPQVAVSRAAPAFVSQPKPIVTAFDLPATFSDMQGTNLWHPVLYVQTSTNMVDWKTVAAVPLAETPKTIYLTNASPFAGIRTGF